MKLIPPWAQIVIVVGVIAVIFGAGWKVHAWKTSGKVERLEADLRIERANSEGWAAALTRCQANRTELETRLDTLAEFFQRVADDTKRLEGSAREARRRAAERDAAREELARLGEEHAAFIERTRDMNLCQTYEAVIVELAAGGGP
jgi:DNA repair exonuclease SbcCD ATPase subunit